MIFFDIRFGTAERGEKLGRYFIVSRGDLFFAEAYAAFVEFYSVEFFGKEEKRFVAFFSYVRNYLFNALFCAFGKSFLSLKSATDLVGSVWYPAGR